MKNLVLVLCFMGCLQLSAQEINGFFSGVLKNDSANRMIQQYELAISTYKGKISGYSYVTFVVNDTFYYGIRKVKGEIIGDSVVIEDDKFISNNFPESPAKRVKRTITIPLNGQDSIISLNGRWKTNQTRKYYSVPGAIEMNKSNDSAHSALINHLKELGIVSDYNNYVAVNEPAPKKNEASIKTQTAVAKNDVAAVDTGKRSEGKKNKKKDDTPAGDDKQATLPVIAQSDINKKNNTNSKTDVSQPAQPLPVKNDVMQQKDMAKTNRPVQGMQKDSVAGNLTKQDPITVSKRDSNTPVQPITASNNSAVKQDVMKESKPVQAIQRDTMALVNKTGSVVPVTNISKSAENRESHAGVKTAGSKIPFTERRSVAAKTFDIASDSLVLSFYDNGVVDGDSISVYMNGEAVVLNAKLTTTATKKTIKIPQTDEVQLILVAENLGRLPPNTGLLTIKDGSNVYQVHFSADMQTNASIILRKKK